MVNLAQKFAAWEVLIKTDIEKGAFATSMPGSIARIYFSPGGIANGGNLPTSEVVGDWASENGIRSTYDRGIDKYIFFLPLVQTVTALEDK